MTGMIDYEAFEEQYRRPVMAKFESRAGIIRELILTVIVLGLILNILANVIWSMFDPVANLDVLYYKMVVAFGAVAILFILSLYLVRLRFKDLSVIELSFRTVLIWDSGVGRIPPLGYAVFYIPQMDMEALLESDELKEVTRNELIQLDINHNRDLKVARHLFERVFFVSLGSWRGPTNLGLRKTSYLEILGTSNPFVLDAQSAITALSCPGNYETTYQSTNEEGGRLEIRWVDGFSGELSISFGTHTRKPMYSPSKGRSRQLSMLSGMVLLEALPPEIDPKKLISGTFNIRLQAKFSPLGLSLNLNHSRDVYNWVKFLFDDLRHFMDWDYTRFRASRATFSRARPTD
ncbi:MAG: hypothetical protein KGD60_13715 [Candidatus Thorarchaeota archaeon]|nr:hypothetical protein [Candidatus Thorarchaeota archaeon]